MSLDLHHAFLRPALAVAVLALASCATGHYGCPAPNGVTCMSANEIYEATNSAERVVGDDKGRPMHARDNRSPDGRARDERGTPARSRDAVIVREGALEFDDTPATPMNDLGHPPPDSPVRTPPKVMRVWVAPWEDDSGDLHLAGAVFTEIEPRRWSVGEPGGNGPAHLQLIQPLGAPSAGAHGEDVHPLQPVETAGAERGGKS